MKKIVLTLCIPLAVQSMEERCTVKYSIPKRLTFELDCPVDGVTASQKEAKEIEKKLNLFMTQLKETNLCKNLLEVYVDKLFGNSPGYPDLLEERLAATTLKLQSKIANNAISIKEHQSQDYYHPHTPDCDKTCVNCNPCAGLMIFKRDLEDQEKHLKKLMATQALITFLKLQSNQQELQSVTSQIKAQNEASK